MATDAGWYLYAFLSHGDLPLMAGIDGRSSLTLIAEEGIAALASPVSLAEFGTEALRQNLEDPRWLEEKVRLHEAIVEAALAKGPVLPMKFGTIFLHSEGIRDVLRRNGHVLRAALEGLREKAEWGVKGFADRVALRDAVRRNDPALLARTREARAKSPGEAFFLMRKIEESASEKLHECEEALAREALEAIRGKVMELVEDPLLFPEATRGQRIILNLACLVRREGVEDFLAGVEGWNRGHAEEGFKLVASGPWPPYHFVPRL